jgi:hypothetical protein
MKILEVIKAWTTSFNPSDDDIEIARKRSEICENCEFKVELDSALLSKLTENDKILNKFKCRSCGCPLSKKLFAHQKDSCPEGKWEK